MAMAVASSPVVVESGIIIRGGSLKKKTWVPENVVYILDKPFLSLSKSDREMARFLGLDVNVRSPWNENCWPEYLCKLRKDAMDNWIVTASREHCDPLTDEGAPSKRPRKDLMHHVPAVINITIDVHENRSHTMAVASAWHGHAKILFELTTENLTFLSEVVKTPSPMPSAKTKRFGVCPDVSTPNVRWREDTSTLVCSYIDVDGARRKHTQKVPHCDDVAAHHAMMLERARQMEEFFREHHHGAASDSADCHELADEQQADDE